RLDEIAKKICQKAGVSYTSPRELQPPKIGNVEAEADAKIEKKMELAYSDDGEESKLRV
ncbi:MAG: hypothetical protein HPY60_11325, partial [Candidatus Methanofastidiosum sp.]|nr:hypothetical protein [Methanofastidiosum sp.]